MTTNSCTMRRVAALSVMIGTLSQSVSASTLLEEKFDSTGFADRGWFDSTNATVSTTQHINGSLGSLEVRYPIGAVTAVGLSTAMRHTFAASDAVYVRYYVKYSDNWQGSNKPYHPHEFYLLTTADSSWIGPSSTHFTAYIEQNEGFLQLGMQDSLNIDATRIGVDLTNVTESRAVAGCNGNPDGVSSSCYKAGTYRNGKQYRSTTMNFTDSQGPNYKSSWHKIEAFIKFNTVTNGKGNPDGIMMLWQDGKPVIDRKNIIMRTAVNADMKFNSILVGPYIGDGSPVDQTTWIDDLLVSDTNLVVSPPMPPSDITIN